MKNRTLISFCLVGFIGFFATAHFAQAERAPLPDSEIPLGINLCGIASLIIVDGEIYSHADMVEKAKELHEEGRTKTKVISIDRTLPIDCKIWLESMDTNETAV